MTMILRNHLCTITPKLYADGLKRAENDDDQNDVAFVCYYYIIDVLILSDRSI